jgi:hypothetical protein
MIAQVQVKNIYGNDLIYPMNEQAKILAKIAGKVTLTPITVELAKQLGIKFEVIQNPVTL